MLEKAIELIRSANWETIGALILVVLAALGRFFKGFIGGLKEGPKPAPCDDQQSSPRMKRWEGVFQRIEENTQDLKSDTRQLGRDAGRDHELLVDIKDGVDRIEKMLK